VTTSFLASPKLMSAYTSGLTVVIEPSEIVNFSTEMLDLISVKSFGGVFLNPSCSSV
jgi:hypothetical protein